MDNFISISLSDSDDDEDSRQWMMKHNEDILSIAAYETSVVATSSYDGDIFIWSLETAHPLCLLNANDGVSPRSGSRTVSYAYKAGSAQMKPAETTRVARRSSAASRTSSVSVGDNDTEANPKVSSSKNLSKRASTKTLLGNGETENSAKEVDRRLKRANLPAIGSPKASFTDTGGKKQSEGINVDDSHTSFTESLSNFRGRRAQSGRTGSSSGKSFYVDVEDSKEYTKKHESAVDKVSDAGP